MKETVRVSMVLDTEIQDGLKEIAKDEDRSVSSVVRNVVKKFIKEYKEEK